MSGSRGPTRTEHDSMGELQVPADALYGAQTQRAVQNFNVSGLRMPRDFIGALGLVKAAVAGANGALGLLPKDKAAAIRTAALNVAGGEYDKHFPIDIYQTGSGTSSNMNANEVIAALASKDGAPVHPNDDVNLGQSSNDVVPTAIQVAAAVLLQGSVRRALVHLRDTIDKRAVELADVVKTGRTHLMDAMPLTLGQELSGWSAQMTSAIERLDDTAPRLLRLPLGGTAIGTGINADKRMPAHACKELTRITGLKFVPAKNKFEGLAGADVAVELSGQLNALAVTLMKICNDLRWMNSGPLAGLGEIELPALQPGSSIMPGKVNPVIPESVAMVCVQVMGHHAAISIAGQSGNFQLNVMLPLIAANLLESLRLVGNATRMLADKAIAGFTVRRDRLDAALARNPILVTALNPVIGYEAAAKIAKRAYAENRPVLEVAIEMTDLGEKKLRKLLDPAVLTKGGIGAGPGGG
jgi:fumarate hydratase class II